MFGKRRWTIPPNEAGAKLGGRIEIVSADTAQGDDGRHGFRPQVIGILGTGQRSSLTPLRPFIGHHPKTKKKKNENFFLPVLFVLKTCSLLFKPMYVLYCVFVVSTSLRRFTSASKASSFRLYPLSLPEVVIDRFSTFCAVANEFYPMRPFFYSSHLDTYILVSPTTIWTSLSNFFLSFLLSLESATKKVVKLPKWQDKGVL